jgi:hypothetical protein
VPTLAAQHPVQQLLGHQHRHSQVHIEGTVQLFRREVIKPPGRRERRIGDHDVGVSQAGDEPRYLPTVGQIADDDLGTVQLRRQRLEGFLPSIGKDEASATGVQGTGNRATKATGSACHHRFRTVDLHSPPLLSIRKGRPCRPAGSPDLQLIPYVVTASASEDALARARPR